MNRSKYSFEYLLLLTTILVGYATAYSALDDARIIAEYRRKLQADKNHAKIARTLVHQANWAAVGTISTNTNVFGFPMVNIISIDDNNAQNKSTGKIHFMLTDLDFTGPDWRIDNRVTFLFTDDQNKNCAKNGQDPMEPTCARAMISGHIRQLVPTSENYHEIITAFIKRHPAAVNWIKAHTFYLCELDIENIFVLDGYGGPHIITEESYYNAEIDNEVK